MEGNKVYKIISLWIYKLLFYFFIAAIAEKFDRTTEAKDDVIHPAFSNALSQSGDRDGGRANRVGKGTGGKKKKT